MGQAEFFKKAKAGKANWETREELDQFLSTEENMAFSKHNLVLHQLKRLHDEELCDPWNREIMSVRRKNHNDPRYEELSDLLVKHRSDVWLGNWLDEVGWFDLSSEEKHDLGKKAYKEFVGRESYNEVFSSVVGAMDCSCMT